MVFFCTYTRIFPLASLGQVVNRRFIEVLSNMSHSIFDGRCTRANKEVIKRGKGFLDPLRFEEFSMNYRF